MSFLGQEEQLREYQDRFKYLYVALFVGLGIILARLVFLQILSGDQMRRYSEENRIKRVEIPAPRGMIFDRNRTLLIDNRPSFDLEITPQYLRESKRQDEVVKRLAELLGIPADEIKDKLHAARFQPAFRPIKIKTELTRDQVATIESWKIDMPGVAVKMEIKRTNLYKDVASHLLGYIGEVNSRDLPRLNKGQTEYDIGDHVGKTGIEKELEKHLRGEKGTELVEVDALGRRIRESKEKRLTDSEPEKPAVPGKNLILSIDQDLQMAAVEAFGKTVGGLVAIDPNTGEILAMVSRPSFDPTEFSRGISTKLWKKLVSDEDRPLRDRTIQDHFMPGSVFKVVTAIAVLEEGVVNENTKFHCPGAIRVGNRTVHCHGRHGDVNLVEALRRSCDVYFYRASQKLKSVDDIAKWAKHLGLGRRTGIPLAREVPGLIPTEAWKQKRFGQPWTAGETVSVSIGQSFVLTTVLQLANLYAAIANGGTLYKPFFIKGIESHDGSLLSEFSSEIMDRAEISEKSLELVKRGLWEVVNHPLGTAHSSVIPGADFVGKTGTAQVIRLSAEKLFGNCEEFKYRFRHHGLFAGFAPADNPKIAVAAIAEHSCSGSRGGAPLVRAVVKKYLEKYHPDLLKKQNGKELIRQVRLAPAAAAASEE